MSERAESHNASIHANSAKAGSMFLFALCLFWLTNSGFDTSEGSDHYIVAEHCVETGEIGFDHSMRGIFTVGPDGRTYASHEFGNTLFLIPTAALNLTLSHTLTSFGVEQEKISRLRQFVISFQAGLYSSLTLMFLFLILVEEFKFSSREAFLGCLLLGTCTFFWTYSRNLFDGVLCSLLLTVAFRYLLRYRREGRMSDAIIAFGALGFAVDTRLSMALAVISSLLYMVMYCNGYVKQGLVIAIFVLSPFAAWQLWYNHIRTGNMLISPVQTLQYADNNALDGDIGVGLTGLLFSPGKSIFIYSPLLLISVINFPRFWRLHRATAVFVLILTVMWLVLHAKLRSWYGAWGWGPRHFVTIIPILSIPALVSLPYMWKKKSGKAILTLTVLCGFLLAASSLICNWHYRMVLCSQNDTIGDQSFVWKFSTSQPIDMLLGALNNVGVLFGIVDPEFIADASDLNNYASNRINMWWFILPYVGISRTVVGVVLFLLSIGLVLSSIRLTRRK